MILGRDDLIPRGNLDEDGAAAVPPELAERVAAVELQGNFMFDPVRSLCAVAADGCMTWQGAIVTCFHALRRLIETSLGRV